MWPVPAAAPASDPAPSAIPAGFIGVWDYEKGTCDPASDMRLAIGQDRFEFYESVGEVKAVHFGAREPSLIYLDRGYRTL